MKFKHLLGPLPSVGGQASITIIFIVFFIGLCWFVCRRERAAVYAHLERLPLEEESHD